MRRRATPRYAPLFRSWRTRDSVWVNQLSWGGLVRPSKGARRRSTSKPEAAKPGRRARSIAKVSTEATSRAEFAAISKPELVVGLVGAVGTDLDLLTQVVEEELDSVGYKTSLIRLSELLLQFDEYKKLPSTPTEARYHAYMTAGNGLREDLVHGDAMALLGIAAIREARRKITGDHHLPDEKGRVYVVRSRDA